MSFTHEVSFSADIEERFGVYAKDFGLSILSCHFSRHGIEADRPLDNIFFEAAKTTNSGLLLKATLLPGDAIYLRGKGFEIGLAQKYSASELKL